MRRSLHLEQGHNAAGAELVPREQVGVSALSEEDSSQSTWPIAWARLAASGRVGRSPHAARPHHRPRPSARAVSEE